MSELRQRRLGLFTLHEAAVNAVTAREHAHQTIAGRTLDRTVALIDAGHDERAAADIAQAELAARETDQTEQLQRSLDEHARRVAYPVIERDLEARVLAVPVTEQDIDKARTAAERDMLTDLAACQHAITRLRDTSYTSTAADATGLYLECREQHGHDREQARGAAFLEVCEGVRAEHDTARYRLDADAEQRRDERTTAQRRDDVARPDRSADHDVAGQASRGAAWEDVRAPLLRVGDTTPRGPITAIDYYGELGVTVHVGDEEYHRGRDDVVSRRPDRSSDSSGNPPEREQPPAARDRDVARREELPSGDVDADELAQLTAGAHERRATASRIPDDVDRLRDMLVRDHEAARERRAADPGLHQHRAMTSSQSVQSATRQPRYRDGRGDAASDDDGDHLHGAAVDAHARAAVAIARQRDQQQQAEEARTEQVNRWNDDDRAGRRSAERARSVGGRATGGWEVAR